MRFHKGSGVSTRCSWQPASRAYFSSANSDPRLSSGIVFFNPLSPTPLTSTVSDLQDSFIFAFTWSLKLGVNVALTFSIFAQMGLVVQRWNFDRRGSFWLEKKEVDTPVSSLSAVWRIHETAAMCNSYLPMVREYFYHHLHLHHLLLIIIILCQSLLKRLIMLILAWLNALHYYALVLWCWLPSLFMFLIKYR